jgi:hypothetical protein
MGTVSLRIRALTRLPLPLICKHRWCYHSLLRNSNQSDTPSQYPTRLHDPASGQFLNPTDVHAIQPPTGPYLL